MSHHSSRTVLVAALAVFLCLFSAFPSTAQKSTLPPALDTSNPQPAFIKNQLQVSVDLARKTIAGFEAMPPDDSIPIDESTLQNARNTYVLIRAARHGIELNQAQSKFPDPVMNLAYKRVTDAWNIARAPAERATYAVPRAQYISESIQGLNQVVRLINQALVIIP